LWVRYRLLLRQRWQVIMVPLATSIATIVIRMGSPPHRRVTYMNTQRAGSRWFPSSSSYFQDKGMRQGAQPRR
jgi:hypothetical protein